MKQFTGKSNIDIVKDYLAGERPFQQISLHVPEKDKYRKDGEEWEEDGVKYRRENGKTVRLTQSQADLIRSLTKQICKCGQEIRWGSRFDKKLYARTGLCETCLIDYETKLRIVGVYDAYEKYKLLSYEDGSLKTAKDVIEGAVNYFSTDSGDVTMLCNSEGFTERWKNTNQEKILEDAKAELKHVTERLAEVAKLKEFYKEQYKAGAEKFKLEYYG